MLEVIETARRVTGRPIAITLGPRRPGDPAALLANPGRAARELGWRPRFGLEDMIRTAWAWRQSRAEAKHEVPCAG